MTALAALLEAPAATTLAWTLLHFLWQGAVLAAALLLVIRYGRLPAAGRYAAGVATLALMLAAPIATFIAAPEQLAPAVGARAPALPAAAVEVEAASVDVAALVSLDDAAPAGKVSISAILVGVWSAGVLVLATRLFGGWWVARRLARRVMPVGPEIESMAVRLAGRLALDRVVRIAQSPAVAVPVMVGWFKPMVLFPASVLSGLSPTQIEALLAHELAHVRRHDYLVNLLQSVVETLLFYHPAVWWVSRRVRLEREHCCDDIALGVCDRLVYATALSDLAALARPPHVALAATDGSLLQRVRRILAAEDGPERGAGWLPVLIAVALAALLVPAAIVERTNAAGELAGTEQRVEGVREGVAGGVPGGVRGGVPGGVRGGVRGGVEGGVEGGVGERDVAGVAGGVAAGVLGGVAVRPARSLNADELKYALIAGQSQQQQQEELARRVAELQRATELRMRELERERQALEEARLQARYRAERVVLETELKALDEQRTRMKQQVEAGTLSPTELGQVERQLVILEQRLKALQTEHDLDRRELELRREQTEQMRELEKVMAARERGEAVVVRERDARARVAVAESLASQSLPLDRAETLRAGDVLVIEIHGEPDVPRAYTVSADGTIRLPLSRPVRVAGRTAADVEQEIVRQLTARGLERVAVDVMPRRPRGER
jgi:beta-lactamase regulating signal transducer with metallopeptidase domain